MIQAEALILVRMIKDEKAVCWNTERQWEMERRNATESDDNKDGRVESSAFMQIFIKDDRVQGVPGEVF